MYNLPQKKDHSNHKKQLLLLLVLVIIVVLLLPQLSFFSSISSNYKILIIATSAFLIISLIAIYAQIGKKNTDYDIHGSARWANTEEIIATGLLDLNE